LRAIDDAVKRVGHLLSLVVGNRSRAAAMSLALVDFVLLRRFVFQINLARPQFQSTTFRCRNLMHRGLYDGGLQVN
jgi:hypothetical protein